MQPSRLSIFDVSSPFARVWRCSSSRRWRILTSRCLIGVYLSVMAAACSASGVGSLSVTGVPQTAEAGASLDLALRLQGADPGTVVRVEVVAGGGSVSPALVTFDEGGSQPLTWTLGVAPVPQRIRVFVQGPPDSNGAPNGNARGDEGENL